MADDVNKIAQTVVQFLYGSATSALSAASSATDAVELAAQQKVGHAEALAALRRYDDAYADLKNAAGLSSVLVKCHPASQIRAQATRLNNQLMRAIATHTKSQTLSALAQLIEIRRCDLRTGEVIRQLRARTAPHSVPTDTVTIVNLQTEVDYLKRLFDANIRDDAKEIIFSETSLDGVPDEIAASLEFDATGNASVQASQNVLSVVIRHAHDRNARQRAWRAVHKRAFPANTAVLAKLLSARYDLAKLRGFSDWATYSLRDTIFGSPEAVEQFLTDVVDISEQAVESQVRELQALLKRIEPMATLMPWDVEYLIDQLRKETLSGRDHREYFEAMGTIERALHIAAELFGVTISSKPATYWHSDVRSFTVRAQSPDGDKAEIIGEIYIDAYQRPGKTAGSRTLVIRRGKRYHSSPSCVLVFSFPAPSRMPTLLDYLDIIAILHELGHAFHLILSGQREWALGMESPRTRDSVEVPPQIFEHFGRDPHILTRLTCHYLTAAPIPPTDAAALISGSQIADAIALRTQVLYASLSLRLHQGNPAQIDFVKLVGALSEETTNYFAPVKDVYPHLSFRHLGPYAARCYGYIWSQAVAQELYDAYTKVEDNQQATALLRKHILAATCDIPTTSEALKHLLSRSDSSDKPPSIRANRSHASGVESSAVSYIPQ